MEKSKSGRGWRVLLTELGIIVLGVSIALGADQAVQWLSWRNQVAEAREIIASEMARNLASTTVRLRVQGCIERRLDELGKIVDAASRSGSLPPVGDIAIPPRRLWSSGAWESVVASQTATHFPRAQLAELARTYSYVRKTDDFSPQEVQAWSELGAIMGPGRRLDPASEADLRKAISVARGQARIMVSISYQLVRIAGLQDLPYSQEDLDLIAAARNEPMDGSITPGNTLPTYQVCQPIGVVPPQYGQTGHPFAPALIEQGLGMLPKGTAPGP